jgi:hypothetical protein
MGEHPDQSPADAGSRDTERKKNGMGMLFAFETDLYESLRCIPMAVRYKLDRVGIKVSLRAWNQLPVEQRRELFHAWPAETEVERRALRGTLRRWLEAVSDEPLRRVTLAEPPPWEETARLNPAVAEQAARCRPPLTVEEWAALERLERFALVKLAAAKHERGRFRLALAEFRRRRGGNEEFMAA